jgi:exoribonuclease R
MVAFWMIQMNTICGKMMSERGVGIFRQASWHPDANYSRAPVTMIQALADLPESVPQTTRRLIVNWKHTTGQYVAFDPTRTAEHATMGKESYVHITSPIRRIIDLLNQIVFQMEFGMIERISDDARAFLEHWYSEMEYVNTTMRSIRKVQIDCDMLHRCSAHPEWMQQLHQGVIFDRISRTDGMYSYMVHLTGLNILARVTSQEKYENYQTTDFKMFVFEDEERLQRKIRISPVQTDKRN